MQTSGWLLSIIIMISIIAFLIIKWLSKRRFFRGRYLVSLTELYQKNMIGTGVDCETFEKVFNIIGHAYRVDPRKLRPSDKLQVLYDLDTWDIGEGTEELNEQLAKEFGITEFEAEPNTISELMIEVKKQLRKNQ